MVKIAVVISGADTSNDRSQRSGIDKVGHGAGRGRPCWKDTEVYPGQIHDARDTQEKLKGVISIIGWA